ncbi:MAG: D-tyrosyl-tRNA(Tyr) deacylase [Candidatus Latescibacteria bacterium]|nr:D-tyrosyl-tRNA(Tyr) deacylase [bacterium]MBD3424419.1 D-tyrosyl-tRNA(Tyr) deacylase [Candidatus Latescibacterota bacterium]
MRAVIQRVSRASVSADGSLAASIGPGIMILAAFRKGDGDDNLDWTARKCLQLRIFQDSEGKMNRSVMEEDGEVLVVSQFTLYGNCLKGRRPAYTDSAPASEARELYRRFIDIMSGYYPRISEGVFGAKMKVDLVNDGPVTLIVDRDK